jgi:hypothetical protein
MFSPPDPLPAEFEDAFSTPRAAGSGASVRRCCFIDHRATNDVAAALADHDAAEGTNVIATRKRVVEAGVVAVFSPRSGLRVDCLTPGQATGRRAATVLLTLLRAALAEASLLSRVSARRSSGPTISWRTSQARGHSGGSDGDRAPIGR